MAENKKCWACKRTLVGDSKLGLCPDCLNKYGSPAGCSFSCWSYCWSSAASEKRWKDSQACSKNRATLSKKLLDSNSCFLKHGEMVAFGKSSDIIRDDLLHEIYGNYVSLDYGEKVSSIVFDLDLNTNNRSRLVVGYERKERSRLGLSEIQ